MESIIEAIKHEWEQILTFIKLKEVIDNITENLPYFKTLSIIVAILEAPKIIKGAPRIIQKIENWFRCRHLR